MLSWRSRTARCLRGTSIGAPGSSVGEVVFNTSMTGYQEILTDPSYCSQIVTLTYPHIGNVGINSEDVEAARIHAAGLVIRDLAVMSNNWRSRRTLPEYLQSEGIVAIAGVDTRRLTRILRDKGAQSGCLMAGAVDEAAAVEQAKRFPGLAGMDLAKVVSCDAAHAWEETEWRLEAGYGRVGEQRHRVVALDYGVKRNILRKLATRGCAITVLPAQSTAKDVLALAPDGVFLSNGPGDPEPCDYAIETIRILLDKGVPIFGICLGHQLLGLAAGGRTRKMKFGTMGRITRCRTSKRSAY
jgi:carbamoyl-phosphate synthase small subunit